MTVLIWLTIVTLASVVVVVAGYLLAIIASLRRTSRHLWQLAEGLEAIEANTRPLTQHLSAINRAAGQLLGGLRQIDEHLKGVAVVLRM
ncbi:MAG: hypothetical protein QN203_06945 [Armatimonadota bacterium]|nr:hypothetical protein [Armatimonadota bacterium]